MPYDEKISFSVRKLQILDESGKCDDKAKPDIDNSDIKKMYELMVTTRIFDDNALKHQREERGSRIFWRRRDIRRRHSRSHEFCRRFQGACSLHMPEQSVGNIRSEEESDGCRNYSPEGNRILHRR